ncbi:hypothetical protein P3W45_001123 [Vairimorpha bombi]|jgi:hypothetical protein
MIIRLFKQIEYKPHPITSISSNTTNIYIFRSNKTLEILDKLTLQKISCLNINYSIIKSVNHFKYLLCISDIDEVLWINLTDMSIKVNKIGYKLTDIIVVESKIYLTTYNGFLLEIFEDDLVVRFKTNSLLSCLVHRDDYFIIGGTNKIYLVGSDFVLKNEIDINEGSVTRIDHSTDDKFGMVTDQGYFIYIDIKLVNIIQTTQVRLSSLNTLLIKSGHMYTSGEDSRLICYKLIKDSFIKLYQIDLHYGVSKCILYDSSRIFVGNTDGILSCLVPDKDKFSYIKIYDRNVEVSVSDSKLLINNRSSLDLFYLDEGIKFDEKAYSSVQKSLVSESCTFKLKNEFFKDLSVKNLPYKNLLKISNNEYITTSKIIKNLIFYSDTRHTRIIEISNYKNKLNQENKLQIHTHILNEYFKDIQSTYISHNNNNFIIQDSKNTVHLINKIYNNRIKQISCENKINIMDNKLVNIHTGKLLIGTSNLVIKDDEAIISCIDNGIYLTQVKDFNIPNKYRIYFDNKLKDEFSIYDIIIKIFVYQNEIWYSTQTYLLNVERKTKFDLGAVIYDIFVIDGNIVVIKDDWNYIKNYLKKGVFKKKYFIK